MFPALASDGLEAMIAQQEPHRLPDLVSKDVSYQEEQLYRSAKQPWHLNADSISDNAASELA